LDFSAAFATPRENFLFSRRVAERAEKGKRNSER
jgi:hypothetical protein